MRRLSRWVGLVLVIGLLGLAAYQYQRLSIAHAKTDAAFARYLDPDYDGLTWDDLTPAQQRIWLTVEDPAFFDHNGVDFRSPGAGLTTITQSLAKRLYFDPFEPGFAKLEQSLIAIRVINARIPKEVQLSAALDLFWFGRGADGALIGFEAAAQHHFGRGVVALSDAQFTQLVALLIGPNAVPMGSDALAQRVARIERLLAEDCTPTDWRDVWLEGCR